jgi:hypothetical protein
MMHSRPTGLSVHVRALLATAACLVVPLSAQTPLKFEIALVKLLTGNAAHAHGGALLHEMALGDAPDAGLRAASVPA